MDSAKKKNKMLVRTRIENVFLMVTGETYRLSQERQCRTVPLILYYPARRSNEDERMTARLHFLPPPAETHVRLTRYT